MKPDQSQSRRSSLVEPATNVVVGYLLALLIQRAVFPLFDIHTTLAEDGVIAALFAAASLARSYVLRRLFPHMDRQRDLERVRRQQSLELRLSTVRR